MSCQPEPRLVCSVFICIKRNKATTARKAKPENPEWQSTNYWVISLLLHPALIYCLLGIFIESYKRQLQLFLQAKFNPTYLLYLVKESFTYSAALLQASAVTLQTHIDSQKPTLWEPPSALISLS